jgi:glycosyltransferase involved in cell wall biosynthesis
MTKEVSPSLGEVAAEHVDPSAYIAIYPDITPDPDVARRHYFEHGRFEGRYPSEQALEYDRLILIAGGVFDPSFYRLSAGAEGVEDLARHYLLHGWRSGVEPAEGFDSAFLAPYFRTLGYYRAPGATYAQLRIAGWGTPPNREAADVVARLVRSSAFFDAEAYRARLGANELQLDPALHYVLVGERLGIAPSDLFDPDYYGERYPDVAQANVCYLAHYIEHGRAEGRSPRSRNLPADPARFAPEKETIILVSHEASRTGAPIVALNIARRLSEKYNIVTVLLRGGDLMDSFRQISAQLIHLEGNDRHPIEFKYAVNSILRNHKIRYAIVNSIVGWDILPSLGIGLVPTVALIHEFASYSRPRGTMREALGWATELVFSTEITADSFRKEHPALWQRRVHIVPQGQCQPTTAPAAEKIAIERRRLKAGMRPPGAENALVVLGCGSVHIRKGVDLFLRSASAALNLGIKRRLRFVWIGHGYDPEKDESYSVYLAEQIDRSGLSEHLVVLDEVTDLEPAYAMADVFLLASRLDPLPNVTIDAAMRGLPIICFDGATGMAEILRRDATAAITVVPHLDAEAAARRIIAFAEDEDTRRRVGEATHALAQATFDMDRYVARIDEIGADAIETMRQRRSDFETIRNDPSFDPTISLSAEKQGLPLDAAISHFLTYWSAARTAPHQVDHLDIRRPCAGFNPQIYAHHHPEVLTADANPFADFIRNGHPGGPWLHSVMRPDRSISDASRGSGMRTAIHAHFYYADLIWDFLSKLYANSTPCDLLLTTNDEEKVAVLRMATKEFDRGTVDIRVVPNRGRDLGPLLSYAEILRRYDVIGHFHGKRSLGVDPAMGEIWREFLWQHLVGDLYPMMDVAVSHFAKEDQLGLVFAEEPHLCDWSANLALSEKLAVRMGIEPPLPPFFEFPVGSMFWARPSALSPLLDLKLDWDDYPEEPIPDDGTILHALERLIPFSVGKVGLTWSTVHIPGVTR